MFSLATAACRGSVSRVTSRPEEGRRTGKPDRAVAAQGPDLEDGSGAAGQHQEVQQLALVWCHVDRGKAGGGTGLERRVEHGVRRHQEVVEVTVDFRPLLLVSHNLNYHPQRGLPGSGRSVGWWSGETRTAGRPR